MENSVQRSAQIARNESFHEKYSSKGWVGRKIIAVPKAFVAGVLKVVYHLGGGALFHGVPKALSGDRSYLKLYRLKAVQDIKEASGWITTLFDDRLGQSNVHDSIHWKQSSDKDFLCKKEAKFLKSQIESYFSQDSQGTRIIKDKGLFNAFIKTIIDTMDPQKWKSLIDIRSFIDHEIYAFNPLEIYGLISTLFPNEESYHEENRKIIQGFPQQIIDHLLSSAKCGDENNERLYGQYLISLCTDIQKENLNFSLINERKIKVYFPISTDSERLSSEKIIHSVRQESIQKWIENTNNQDTDYFFSLLSNDQKKNIRISQLSEEQINNLFKGLSDDRLGERLNCFSKEEIQGALCNHILRNTKAIQALSNEQLKGLAISGLKEEQMRALVEDLSDIELRERLNCFSDEEIQRALCNHVLIDKKAIQALSNDQLQNLDISKLSEAQITNLFSHLSETEIKDRISLFKNEDIHEALYKKTLINWRIISVLSHVQLKNLNISRLLEDQISALFPSPSHSEEKKALQVKMSLFKKEDIQKALYDGIMKNIHALHAISADQLKGITTKSIGRQQTQLLLDRNLYFKFM